MTSDFTLKFVSKENEGGEVVEIDDVLIQVPSTGPPSNESPVADAGPDQTVTDTDDNNVETITLDGSGSSDPDGTIDLYEWIDGSSLGTGEFLDVDFTVGTHVVTLEVTDNDGSTDTDTVTIIVEDPGPSPIPNCDLIVTLLQPFVPSPMDTSTANDILVAAGCSSFF